MNKYYKISLFTGLGAAAGYLYYHFFGCTNGCPLQSNWYIMTMYGALAGLVLGFPSKKKNTETEENASDKGY